MKAVVNTIDGRTYFYLTNNNPYSGEVFTSCNSSSHQSFTRIMVGGRIGRKKERTEFGTFVVANGIACLLDRQRNSIFDVDFPMHNMLNCLISKAKCRHDENR